MPDRSHESDQPDALEARRERIRRAYKSLGETLSSIMHSVEEKRGERCPYRAATDACTYAGGCINKRRLPDGTKVCGGDHKLRWDNAKEQNDEQS